MYEIQTPEHKETKNPKGLIIVEPHIDKNFMIAYGDFSSLNIRAYNRAIKQILEDNGFNIFHQVNVDPSPKEPGYQAWEIFSSVNKKELTSLLPLIEKQAQKELAILKKLYPNEK